MKNIIAFVVLMLLVKITNAQVAEMNWSLDYQIYLKLTNDSNYVYDIREAFHVVNSGENITSEFVFYPVNPGLDFVNALPEDTVITESYKTLWAALHAKIGGGWIHFTNCIAYALETQKLDLNSPLMIRPQTGWRPDPVTESYLRTKDWKCYIPIEQKLAQKEYKIRLSDNELGDLINLPVGYIDLFLNTSQKEYNKLITEQKYNTLAKINLVKLLLGAKYLGEVQISYISNSVLESVLSYSNNMLPSVIIFDEYDAAALLSLNTSGYKIDKIVYKSSANISEEEGLIRNQKIADIIQKINTYNQNSFKKRLGNYYK